MSKKSIPQRKTHKTMSGEELLNKLAQHATNKERKKGDEGDGEDVWWKKESGAGVLREQK